MNGVKLRLGRRENKRIARERKRGRKRQIRERGRHDRWWLLGKYGTTDGVAIFGTVMVEGYDKPFQFAAQIEFVENGRG